MASNQPVIWKFKFVRSDGLAQEIVVPPGQSFMVGRDPVCECRLDGRKVSRRHCRLRADANGVIQLEDNGSHNGTFVNGQRIVNTTLQGGEIILIGEWQGEAALVEMNATPAPSPSMAPKATTALPNYSSDPTRELTPLESPAAENPLGEAGVPMTGSWRWQENAPIDGENDGICVVFVDQNPIV
jgi:predicted component of type VI protein secretion system